MNACSAPTVSASPAARAAWPPRRGRRRASVSAAVAGRRGEVRDGRLAIVVAYCEAAMLPSTATPSAAPSSRVASFMAEPAPARRAGTADMIDAVIGDMASAMPATSGTNAHAGCTQYDVSTPRPRNSEQPDGDAAPSRRRRRGWRRSARQSRGVSGATTIMIGAIGRKRSAAPSGL